MRCKMPWWGGQRNSSLKTAFKHLYKLLKESIMALHQRTGSTKKLPFSSICQAWQAHWSIRPGMSFQAIAKQKQLLWLILMLLSCFPPMSTNKWWPPSCGPVCTSEVEGYSSDSKMDTPGVQQHSAQINCLINNSEHNEVKLNVSDTDADLSFIKKLEICEGHKKNVNAAMAA